MPIVRSKFQATVLNLMNNIEDNLDQSFKNLKDEEILEKSLENPRFFEYLVDKY